MSGSVNKVVLVGNLARDPEVRATASGGKIVNLTVVTSESWKDKETGERKERAEFHRVVVFNERIGGVAEQFLRKGRKVYIEGSNETRKYTDKTGQEKYTTEIVLRNFRGELVLLDSANAREGAVASPGDLDAPPVRPSAGQPPSRGNYAGVGSDMDDVIPF